MMLGVLVAGCMTPIHSEAPLATNFKSIAQSKPQSSGHWQLIANHVVEQLKASFSGKPIFVSPAGADEADFPQVFRLQMVSALVGNGVKVLKGGVARPSDALTLDIDARLVRFSPGRQQARPIIIKSAVIAGIWLVNDALAPNPATVARLATTGLAGAADWSEYNNYLATGPTPDYELVVTVSISNAKEIVGQRTDVYYISDIDKNLYVSPATTPLQSIKVRGGA